MIRALLLDLDDTLYDESDFVDSGFRVVATQIAARCGQAVADVHAAMLQELVRSGRGRVFDATLAQFGLPVVPEQVNALVALYRGHRPSIRLSADAAQVLPQLVRRYRLAVVTDGLPQMQKMKVQALGLGRLVDKVVYCWEHAAPKPDPTAYRCALDALGVGPAEAVVVGDRPDHDLAAAAAIGCRAVRLRHGRFAATDSAPYPVAGELRDLAGLPGLLRDLARQ